MNETELTALKIENARLNRMLEALLTANEYLKRENAALKTGNASPEPGYSDVENESGITNGSSSVMENGSGTTDLSSSNAENMNGRKDLSSSVAETGNGRKDILPALPEKIEPEGNIVLTIREKLNSGAHIRVKKSSLRSHAIMLIHFHNKGGGSHPELRKLTGLSEGGLSKSIMALTKRGLIMRDGFQRFLLTTAAKELLKQCLANPIPNWGKQQTPAV